ncbi:MAG TPA: hypothetical protein PLW99_01460 [Candidatus Paceibacterota bacterium]|nr:MAG: hypothetical protein B7X03_03590 [Parcubacteria group bacterium 21-58-10]HQT82796.1 hypothetical protein [Candidatus Paceibacterota bacterium]
MPLTYFYAQLFGLAILIIGLAMLVNRRAMLTLMRELLDNRALLYLAGVMSLFLGIIVILTHNVWSGGALVVLVTLLGWALLLRACLILFLPHGALKNLFASFKFEQSYYLVTLLALLLGIFLTYYGFSVPVY